MDTAKEAGKIVDDRELALRVRARMIALRRTREWYHKDVADRLGINRVTYTNLEGGKQKLTLGFLWAVAQLYGVPLGVLVAPEPVGDET